MTAQSLADPFRPRALQGMRRGAVLALVVHGGLVAALALAVSWRVRNPAPVVAELWSTTVQEAAPPAVAPEPDPQPPPEPERRSPPPPAPTPKADPQADIALKKAREAEKKEREQQRERQAAEERRRELAEKEKARLKEREKEREREREKEKERLKEREKQKERERLKAEKAEKAAEERAEAARQENLARIKGMAGATGGAESSGNAAQSSGPSAGYAGRIKARIKPLIVYPDSLPGNPVAEVEVRLAPSGAIVGQRLLRKSESPEWDAAVMRALEKAEMLPRDVDGRVPSVIVIQFSRRE